MYRLFSYALVSFLPPCRTLWMLSSNSTKTFTFRYRVCGTFSWETTLSARWVKRCTRLHSQVMASALVTGTALFVCALCYSCACSICVYVHMCAHLVCTYVCIHSVPFHHRSGLRRLFQLNWLFRAVRVDINASCFETVLSYSQSCYQDTGEVKVCLYALIYS